MSAARRAAGVAIVTGDTKVVNRGSADKLFVTTTGIGLVPDGVTSPRRTRRPGDVILLSGTIADHGMAVLSKREGLEFEGEILSDTQPLHRLVAAMLAAGRDPRAARPHARRAGNVALRDRRHVERRRGDRRARDPGARAGQGRVRAARASTRCSLRTKASWSPSSRAERADAVLEAMRATRRRTRMRAIIGSVVEQHPGMALLKTEIGGTRVLDLPFNEQLPRIC